jgi:hypothetical protein
MEEEIVKEKIGVSGKDSVFGGRGDFSLDSRK